MIANMVKQLDSMMDTFQAIEAGSSQSRPPKQSSYSDEIWPDVKQKILRNKSATKQAFHFMGTRASVACSHFRLPGACKPDSEVERKSQLV